jgi:hypothetical protein
MDCLHSGLSIHKLGVRTQNQKLVSKLKDMLYQPN